MRNAQTFQRMEMPLCGWGTCSLRMETPLRGHSGGHTGAAPTISRVVRFTRLPARCSPMDKNEEGCVVEGFDGGW